MKSPTFPYRGKFPVILMCTGILLTGGWPAQTKAESVDSELVLLVDAAQAALNNTGFSQLMDGYAAAFSSSEILDSIQSGASGKIAVSLMFFGNTGTQQVGIPWMMIGDSAQALQFASLVQNVPRPFFNGTSDVASALSAASTSFGTETGGSPNGFESAVQIIEVAEARSPQNNSAAAVSTNSSSALLAGVDIINSLALGNQASAIDNFYAANVIGSTIPGMIATNSTAPLNNSLATTMVGMLSGSVQAGATTSITAVPEPGPIFSLMASILILLKRRRR